MAHASETERPATPEWKHEGIETACKELADADVTAATKIHGCLSELGAELTDKSPVRLRYRDERTDRQDIVFNPEDGSLTHEVWKTYVFAPDVPYYYRSTYGDNIELERIKPRLEKSTPLPLEGYGKIWIESGRRLANAIHQRIVVQKT